MKNIWYRFLLRRQKQRALFECKADVKFIEVCKGHLLKQDEGPLRARLRELKQKEELTDEEGDEMSGLIDRIAYIGAAKNELEKTKALIRDLESYIAIL